MILMLFLTEPSMRLNATYDSDAITDPSFPGNETDSYYTFVSTEI